MAERTTEASKPVAAPNRAPAPAPRMVVARPVAPVAEAAVSEGPKTPPWRAWEASAPASPATVAAGLVAPRSITAAIPIAPAVPLGRAPAPAAPPTVVAAASVATPGTASVAAVTAKGTSPTAIAAPGSLGVPLLTPLSLGAFQPRDPGQPLPSSVRTRLQPTHGAPAVMAARVHSDDEARAVTQAMGGARAVAIGAHVYFAPGEYRPGTPEGDKLIAHEIAHVVQWQAGSLRGPAMKGPGDGAGGGHEAHADAMAAKATAKGDRAPAKGEGAGKGENSPGASKPTDAATAAAGDAGGGAGPEPVMPEGPSKLTPDAKARLAKVEDKAGDATQKQADVPVAESEVGTARASVAEPAEEAKARASGALAATLDDREPPSPEIEEVCRKIKAAIHAKQPPDKDSLLKADPEQLAKAAGDEQKAKVDGDVKKVKGSYDDMKTPDAQPAPAPAAAPETPGSVPSPDPNARSAAPTPVGKNKVSLDADVKNSQQQMDDAGMSTAPAKLVEDGPIAEARDAQGELSEEAKKSPAEVLAEQAAALQHASGDMAALQKKALAALATARKGHVGQAESQKKGMKQTEEEQRTQAGKDAQTLFDDAEKAVKDQLDPLTDTAMTQWEAGVKKLSTEFKQHLKKVQDWLDERYGKNADTLGKVGGFATEAWDDVTGKPQWVTDEYNQAEETFGNGVCDLITDISRTVNTVVKACQGIIEKARKDIAGVYKKLPESLQTWAAAEQEKFGKKLDGLNTQVTTARDDFNKDLVQRASQAVQEVREQIHALREAAKGLLGKIKDAINEFLDDPVRAIINGLLKVLGIPPDAFWAVLAKIAQAAKDIADDPMNFANNLVAGLGQGFSQFFDHIKTHLFAGFWEWLFSGLKKDGIPIQMPKDYSVKSLILFFLQFLGISYAKVRKLLVEQLGETTVKVLETTWEVVTALITKGMEGLWDLIHDKIKPADIIQAILTAAIEYVVQQVVIKVAARIVMMLNPAGAILQALELIYRVLKWVFNNAARIFRLVEAVVNGVADVIAGNIGGVAKVVERALAMLIPPVIDFIADYFGFGGLPGKVASAVKGLQSTVESAMRAGIKWVVDKAKAVINAILKKLGLKKDDKDKDKKPGVGEVGKRLPFGSGSESHTLWIKVQGAGATVMVSSAPMALDAWLTGLQPRIDKLTDLEKKQQAGTLVSKARALLGPTDAAADKAAATKASIEAPGAQPAPAAADQFSQANGEVDKDEDSLSTVLTALIEVLGLSASEALEPLANGAAVEMKKGSEKTNDHEQFRKEKDALASALSGRYTQAVQKTGNAKLKAMIEITSKKKKEEKQGFLEFAVRIGKRKNDVQLAVKDVIELPKGFPFKIAPPKQEAPMHEAMPPQRSGSLAPYTTPFRFGYIGGVPVHISKSPAGIASLYLSAFKNELDARRRFGLVIAVNAVDDLARKNEQVVKSAASFGWEKYPLGTLALLWSPNWVSKDGGSSVSLDVVREAYNDPANDKAQADAEEKAGVTKNTIPYGSLRNQIDGSPFIGEFEGLLKAGDPPRVEQIYKHISDADTLSFKSVYEDGALIERFEALLDAMTKDVQKHAGKLPLVISGGYEFRAGTSKEHAQSLATQLQNRLDMAVRQTMASVDPLSVYFPEPNLFIKLDASLKGNFGPGQLESRRYLKAIKAHLQSDDTVFNLKLSIETTAADRFQTTAEGQSGEVRAVWGQGVKLTAKDVQAAFSKKGSQRAFDRRTWIFQISAQYGLADRALTALTLLHEAVFPNRVIADAGYEPSVLLKILPTFGQSASYMQDLTALDRELGPRAATIIEIARKSGLAVSDALLQYLKDASGLAQVPK